MLNNCEILDWGHSTSDAVSNKKDKQIEDTISQKEILVDTSSDDKDDDDPTFQSKLQINELENNSFSRIVYESQQLASTQYFNVVECHTRNDISNLQLLDHCH